MRAISVFIVSIKMLPVSGIESRSRSGKQAGQRAVERLWLVKGQ
jgi:hypothetical protein